MLDPQSQQGVAQQRRVGQQHRVAEVWRSAVRGKLKLIVHVGHCSVADARDLAEHAARIGADGTAAIGSVFFAPTSREGAGNDGEQSNWLWLSSDNGDTWQGPVATPVVDIVPDQIVELKQGPHAGRWTTSAHTFLGEDRRLWSQRLWYSDDQGVTWSEKSGGGYGVFGLGAVRRRRVLRRQLHHR